MREEQAIVEIVPVSKQGELRHFEIKVPMRATAVIGVQTGVMMKGRAAESKVPSYVIGELKLQSLTKPNVFYGTLIKDAFAGEDFANPLAPLGYKERDWAYGNKKELEKIRISASTTVIRGFYKDFLGEANKRDLTYEVFLALWFKIEQLKK